MGHEKTLAFLFADLSGFTALTEAHGDDDAASVAERFIAAAKRALVPTTRLVKTIGDEVMIVADTGAAALNVAILLYTTIDDEPLFPTLRAGVHLGSCVQRNGDYYLRGSSTRSAGCASTRERPLLG